MSESYSLDVFFGATHAAVLSHQPLDGTYTLTYTGDWMASEQAFAFAPGLPMDRPIAPAAVRRFLENLLPEGRALDVASVHWNIQKTMFGDWGWIDRRSATQGYRQDAWLSAVTRPIVIELGAGTTIPSVRHFSQRVIHQLGGRLVRINPNECDVPTRRDVGLRMGAADGLVSIAKILGDGWGSPAAGGGDG